MAELQQGLELVRRAVESDSRGEAKEAVRLYEDAIRLFRQAQFVEDDPSRLQLIKDKTEEYDQRRRELAREIRANQSSVQNRAPYDDHDTSTHSDMPIFPPISASQSQPYSPLGAPPPVSRPGGGNSDSHVPPSSSAGHSTSPTSSYGGGSEMVRPTGAPPRPTTRPSMDQFQPVGNNGAPVSRPSGPPPSLDRFKDLSVGSASGQGATGSGLSASHTPLSHTTGPHTSGGQSSTGASTSGGFTYGGMDSVGMGGQSSMNSGMGGGMGGGGMSSGMGANMGGGSGVHPELQQFQTRAAYTSSTASGAPNPILVRFAQEYPRDKPNLQAALHLAEKAKVEDREGRLQAALDIYTDVLERMLVVLQAEANPTIKQSLREAMTSYMQRAEYIKETAHLSPVRVTDAQAAAATQQQRLMTQSQANQRPLSQSASFGAGMGQRGTGSTSNLNSGMGAAGRGALAGGGGGMQNPVSPRDSGSNLYGSGGGNSSGGNISYNTAMPAFEEKFDPVPPTGRQVHVTNETKSALGRQKLILSVSVQSNLGIPGEKLIIHVKVENRSTMVVNMLRVVLRRIERFQRFDKKGRQVMGVDAIKVDKEDFYQV